jgi:glutamyl-tRNA synthetase
VQGALSWWCVLRDGPAETPDLTDEDRDYVRSAFDLLPEEPWDGSTWKQWTESLKKETGRKGKALFMPLRRALTGLEAGPELAELLPLLGRAGALARRP